MASRWFTLAQSYKLAEEVSGFLQWDAQRLKPPSAFEQKKLGKDSHVRLRAS
jgi:hypothetical protein